MGNKAYLVLENGKVFCGESFGAAGEVTAEVVFTTGMKRSPIRAISGRLSSRHFRSSAITA